MTRLLPLTIIFLSMLFFPVTSGVSGAEQEKLKGLEWKSVDGALKTDLGQGLPEVLVLKLSNADFHKYFANKKTAMDYLDSQHFLKAKLINLKFAEVRSAHNDEEWYIIIGHTPYSTALVIAWQEPSDKKNK